MKEICSGCCSYEGPNVRCGMGLFPTNGDDHCMNFDWKPGVKWSPKQCNASAGKETKVLEDAQYSIVEGSDEMRARFEESDFEIVKDPRYLVSINSRAWAQIYHYTQAVKGEISGWFKVRRKDDFEFVITDVIICNQVCSGAHALSDEDQMTELLLTLNARNEVMEDWCGHFHSHGEGGVFWSKEDQDNIERHNNDNFMISIVTNKDSQILCRIDIYKPVRTALEPNVRIVPTFHVGVARECKKQVARKVVEHGS